MSAGTSLVDIKSRLRDVALLSDDPDTKTAAILIDNGSPVTGAANEMPTWVLRLSERFERPAKYSYIGHAERTLIARCARRGVKTEGLTMAINWFPCADCALAIVEAGISKIIVNQPAYESRKDDPRYKFSEAMSILTESGVAIEWYS